MRSVEIDLSLLLEHECNYELSHISQENYFFRSLCCSTLQLHALYELLVFHVPRELQARNELGREPALAFEHGQVQAVVSRKNVVGVRPGIGPDGRRLPRPVEAARGVPAR